MSPSSPCFFQKQLRIDLFALSFCVSHSMETSLIVIIFSDIAYRKTYRTYPIALRLLVDSDSVQKLPFFKEKSVDRVQSEILSVILIPDVFFL